MKLGLDYSAYAFPAAAAVRDSGHEFVCRYLSWLGNPKNLKPEEIADMHAHGVAVVVVFETTRWRAADGFDAGKYDAGEALDQARRLGWPADRPIYFAVDFEVPQDQCGTIWSYFDGVKTVLGRDRVGVYGSYDVVRTMIEGGLVKYAWQTAAWSAGQFGGPRINLFQRAEQVTVDGVTCDVNEALTTDYGQWPVEDDMPSIDEVRTVVREELRSLFEGPHPEGEVEPGRNPFDVLVQAERNGFKSIDLLQQVADDLGLLLKKLGA